MPLDQYYWGYLVGNSKNFLYLAVNEVVAMMLFVELADHCDVVVQDDELRWIIVERFYMD